MKTAKEIAYKAFCHNMGEPHNDLPWTELEKQERFNNWWSEWYHGSDHKDCFNSEHFVIIDRKIYIKAE